MNLKTLHKNLTGWKTNNEAVRVVNTLASSAVTMMISVTVSCAAGFFLDRYLGYKILCLAIATFSGVVIGFILVLKKIDKFFKQPSCTE
ncbi:MAG: AtpZ/AtpI family protein [Candidatus Cloacimonetes bacterium]|nr:AtpZ/AtpI family protein [Candidatus Cloacimonadota bacterium]